MKKMIQFFKERKKLTAGIAVTLILLFMFFMALFSSVGAFGDPGDSGTVDEIAHIPSGYTYVKDHDFRLNPEHPPFAKALAGVSMNLNKNIKGPESDWSWNAINQWEAGWSMIYEVGNNPKEVFAWARFPMILLMLGLGLFIYKWASEVFGRKVGLIVLSLYAFYPDVLANGRLVTTDIAAAFGFVVATYYFDKALQNKTWKYTIYAALAFGLAQLLKFSAFLLFFAFLLLVIIRAIMERKENNGFWKGFWLNFKPYFWVCFLSVIIVWIAYLPFVWKTPVGIEHNLIEMNLTDAAQTLPIRNFLHHFENNPIMRGLGHYLLGIAMVVARVEGGNNTFILGHLSSKSISWFFPVAWLLKTAIPVIILFFWSLIALIKNLPKERKSKWLLSLFLVPYIVYWAFTLKGSLNIGIRHLMPTVPFVLLIIGYNLWLIFVKNKNRKAQIAVYILLLYLIASTLSNYPNFIAYFNEATPRDQRYERLVDSSLDWGQDMLRLKKYVEENNIQDIKVDYFGGSVRSYYLPNSTEWHSSYGPTTGWIAISATFYQSSKLTGPKEGKWSYEWLDSYKPVKIVGGSILVFHITPEDLQKNPPVSPYEITATD